MPSSNCRMENGRRFTERGWVEAFDLGYCLGLVEGVYANASGTTIVQPIFFLRDALSSSGQPITFCVNLPMAVFAFYTGISLWRVRLNALKLVKVYFLVQLALAALSVLAVVVGASTGAYQGGTEYQTAEMVTTDALNSLRTALFVWIWWSYFKRSKRVRATYGLNL